MKRLVSLLIAALLVVSIIPFSASAADVIEISTAEQLAKIGVDESYPANGSYKLTKSISLSSYDNWTPLCQSSAFSGTFEGNGKTISGLKVNASGTYAGLFGQVSGTVKNLTVSGSVTLNTTSSSASSVYAGILAGNVSGWFATIDSCSTSGEVKATLNCTASWGFSSSNVYAGGVVGNSSSWISMEVLSHKSGAVTATYSGSNVNGNTYAGGIAGKTSAGIVDCYNKADISSTTAKGTTYAGGLAGYCGATETSYNTGKVTANTNCGAIAGYTTGTSKNCYYETGSASQAFGGYAGTSAPTATAKKSTDMINKKLSGFNFDDVWESSLVAPPNHYSKNEIITGSVSVSGNFQVGEKLTADMSKVEPASAYDGLIKYVKYQWERGTKDGEGNIAFEKISGATGDSYTLTSNDLGKYVRLVVRGRLTYGGKLESKEALVAAPVPKNVSASNAGTGIKVTWGSVANAESYTIYRSVYSEGLFGFGAGFGGFTNIGTSTTASFLDTSVENGKKYKYTVSVTINGAESDKSAESNEITATITASGGGNADLTASSTSSGIVVDSKKTFGGAYDGVVYGFTPLDNGSTKITNGSFYTSLLGATNSGSIKVTKSIYSARAALWGTGTVVSVYNSDGSLSKEYVVVIFGDIDGDSVVTTGDLGIALEEAKKASIPEIQKLAANVYINKRLNTAYGMHTVDTADLGDLLAQIKTYNKIDYSALADEHNSFNTYYQ